MHLPKLPRLSRPSRFMFHRYVPFVLAAIMLLTVPGPADASLFAPKADLWPRWQGQTRGSTVTVDHSEWDRLLRAYVRPGADGINLFAYGTVSAADRKALDDYIRYLEAVRVGGLDRAEQLPYWINFYNALTVKVVLDAYPVKSIRDIDISPGLFADGPWGKALVSVEGEAISLDDIEHRILRPIWKDPRIHYAVNCASIGCPNLQTKAFTRANADALMTAGARAYVNHDRGVKVTGGKVTASSLYDWFKADFGGSDAGLLAHLRQYANADLAGRLPTSGNVGDHGYDWSLNLAR